MPMDTRNVLSPQPARVRSLVVWNLSDMRKDASSDKLVYELLKAYADKVKEYRALTNTVR